MSNDLTAPLEHSLERARDFCLSSELSALQWSGHTDYQIREFVIKQDNQTPYAQKRQCARELWSRWTAYQQARHQRETLAIRLIEIEAEREHLSSPLRRWWKTRYGMKLFKIRLARLALEEREAQEHLKAIAYDLEERIFRETAVIIGVYESLPPLDLPNILQDEQDTWKRRMLANGKP